MVGLPIIDFLDKREKSDNKSSYLNKIEKQGNKWSITDYAVLSSHHHMIYSLIARVVGAPQMISQPVSSIFPCFPLPSGTWRIPGLSIPRRCLPIPSSVCLVFFLLSLCLARWFWPNLMNGRENYTTAVCVSLPWSGCLRVVRLPAGSWHGLPRWLHGLCMRCVVSCGSTSFPWLGFSFGALLWRPMSCPFIYLPKTTTTNQQQQPNKQKNQTKNPFLREREREREKKTTPAFPIHNLTNRQEAGFPWLRKQLDSNDIIQW